MTRARSRLSRFRRACSGNAAIEFALVAPVLVALLIGIVDYGRFGFERSDMLAAARSGAQYFMTGGTDTARAGTIVASSWTHKPSDGVIDVQRICECAGAAAQCNQPCADGAVPQAYARITLTGTVDGVFLDLRGEVVDKVRVR